MSIRKQSLKAAEYYAEHPEVVALLFRLNARGESTVTVHEKVNDAFKNNEDFVPLTQTTVRNLLHRNRPYNHPALYSKVDPEDERMVQMRFKKNVKPRGIKKPNGTVNGSSINDHLGLLYEVLQARVVYEAKLQEAIDAGMSRNAVVAWCSVVADGSLEKTDDV